ncbi:fumarylacetoacetate hydrolase family protein [soil metagenome]
MSTVKVSRLSDAILVEHDGLSLLLHEPWDLLMNHPSPVTWVQDRIGTLPAAGEEALRLPVLAPVVSQEVWAAGVTYFRSRTARIEESQDAGGGTFYDRVYSAARPELFFKGSPWRVRASGEGVRIRADSRWNVPEPELALYVNARAQIIGYTIGNDVSSRDIEGENPLYLPQAKTYDGSCALGPAVLLTDEPLGGDTRIDLRIERGGTMVYEGGTTLSQMRRTPEELVNWLFRETSFPHGVVLLTGTGVIPPDTFTLHSGDRVSITIPPIGTLVNAVE